MHKFIVVAIGGLLLVPAALTAQYRHDRRDDGRDDRSMRISGVIADLEQRSDEFKKALDRALDHSRLDGTRREDQLNDYAASLEKAIDRLRDSWNERHDRTRARRYVARAISAAEDIQRTWVRHALRSQLEREWLVLRAELDRLEDAFDQTRVEWRGWNDDHEHRSRDGYH